MLLSCAMSIDGYIHDATETRLLLSNDADFDRVDAVRAGCDAILVGAHTIRQDNPRLLVRSPTGAPRAPPGACRHHRRRSRSPRTATSTRTRRSSPPATSTRSSTAPRRSWNKRVPGSVGSRRSSMPVR
ncbi:hypothetical protein GCM10027610_051850 [Dactylosporangium cerinum]